MITNLDCFNNRGVGDHESLNWGDDSSSSRDESAAKSVAPKGLFTAKW